MRRPQVGPHRLSLPTPSRLCRFTLPLPPLVSCFAACMYVVRLDCVGSQECFRAVKTRTRDRLFEKETTIRPPFSLAVSNFEGGRTACVWRQGRCGRERIEARRGLRTDRRSAEAFVSLGFFSSLSVSLPVSVSVCVSVYVFITPPRQPLHARGSGLGQDQPLGRPLDRNFDIRVLTRERVRLLLRRTRHAYRILQPCRLPMSSWTANWSGGVALPYHSSGSLCNTHACLYFSA